MIKYLQSEDYSEYFTTHITWETKEEVYKWAKNIATGLKIVLIKLNSNRYRITMVCERYGPEHPPPVNPLRSSYSKKCGCRFELLGCLTKKDPSLSKKDAIEQQRWILYVVEGRHNHTPPKTLDGNAFLGRMTPDEQLTVRRSGNARKTPSEIVEQLREEYPGNVTSAKQVDRKSVV